MPCNGDLFSIFWYRKILPTNAASASIEKLSKRLDKQHENAFQNNGLRKQGCHRKILAARYM